MPSSSSTFARRLLSSTALVVGIIAVGAWSPFFHLHLLKSSPPANATVSAAPDSIRLWFSQAPEIKVTRVKVTGPGRAAVPLAPPASGDSSAVVAGVKGKMLSGTYTVAWRTMARDGHVASGSFAFTVGAPSR